MNIEKLKKLAEEAEQCGAKQSAAHWREQIAKKQTVTHEPFKAKLDRKHVITLMVILCVPMALAFWFVDHKVAVFGLGVLTHLTLSSVWGIRR